MNKKAAFVAMALAWATSGWAGELQFPAHNCALTAPKEWEPMTNPPAIPGLVTFHTHPATSRTFALVVDSKSGVPKVMDDKFIAGFEEGMGNQGGRRISGKLVTVAGVQAYERLGRIGEGEDTVSSLTVYVPADGKGYVLFGASREGDASKDVEIREWIAGFRFLSPPAPLNASSPSGYGAGYRTGYLFGQVTGVAVVVLLVVLAIRAVTRRKGAQGGGKPPPFPPPAGPGP